MYICFMFFECHANIREKKLYKLHNIVSGRRATKQDTITAQPHIEMPVFTYNLNCKCD